MSRNIGHSRCCRCGGFDVSSDAPAAGGYSKCLADGQRAALMPNFDLLMTSAATFAVVVLAILTGVFTAMLDFLTSYAAENYVYPGQSRVWVFTYIFSVGSQCVECRCYLQ